MKPYTIENCRRPHTCHARDAFAELSNDKRLQLEFSKQSLAYMFSIRTKNECSVISDLAIHKLIDFCTTYLCDAGFSKLIIVKSKNLWLLENIENVVLPALTNCINQQMVGMRKNHQVLPSHYLCLITSIN